MNARFKVVFEDINYKKWARACGASVQKMEPRTDGGFDLHLTGAPAAIKQFERELGWNAEV